MHTWIRRTAIITFAAVPFLPVPVSAVQHSSPREQLSADANWRFSPGDLPDAESTGFDDAGWRKLDLPHDWSIEGTPNKENLTGPGGGYFPAGIGWYRRTFKAPSDWKGKEVSVRV